MSKPDRITPKEQRFIDEYLIDLNATQAYRRAGYKAKNDNVAGVSAARMLRKPKISAAIEKVRRSDSERLGITRERVLKEFVRIGFSDITDHMSYGPDGVTLKDCSGLSKDQTAAVAEVSQTVTQHGGTMRLKLYDKPAALISLGNHLGLFKPNNLADNLVEALEVLIVKARR